MVDTSVTLSGWTLENPVIPASGTFGFGYEFAELYDINCLGSIALKGTTAAPRYGNPLPRIAECPSGLLNAVGLQNPGVDRVIAEELPKLARVFHKPAIANVSGFSIEEYAETAAKFDACPEIGLLEINVSCPNVCRGGMAFGMQPDSAAAVTRAVKAVTKKPVYLKLSPNAQNVALIAKACEDAGADGICLINTLLGMRVDLKTRSPLLANRTGGLSGPAVFPIAVRMVWDVYEAVKIPVIGVGGVESAENALEMMLAGATAVEVGAANLVDPFACKKIVDTLPKVMKNYHIETLKSITGGAHHG
jgi:dihydroorotate dehydrogenase (NAD+) catalytic subunit